MKNKRISENFRKTSETEIYCKVNLDGKGLNKIDTPIPFINHMFEQIEIQLNCIAKSRRYLSKRRCGN